jgi:hypothetical protein
MDVSLAVLSDFASVTQEGKLNIMGIFGEVNPPGLPFSLPLMYLVIVFDASPAEVGSEKNVRVVMLDGEGREGLKVENTMAVPAAGRPGRRTSFNAILALQGVTFTQPGDYEFSILINGEEKRSVPLRVNEPAPLGL